MLHKTFLDMFVICSVASVNWNYSGVSKNTWSTLFAKLITTTRIYIVKQNEENWYWLRVQWVSVKPETGLQHPMSHWNTLEHPPDGLEPSGLPLITKMRQKGYNIKTLKYLQWINKYVLSVTEKTKIGSDWRIHPNYEIFSHYISDLTQNLMPYFVPYSYSTGTLMHFLSFPVADWSVTTLQKSFKLITVNFCPRCRIEEKCYGS